jgi:hypothetical protein
MAYLLDRPANAATATQQLRAWASQTGGSIAWMYAAYAFYTGGDSVAGDDALHRAQTAKGPNPDWLDKDENEFELGMGVRLYGDGRFRDCATFCNAVLAAPHRIFTNRNAVAAVAAMAGSPAASRPAAPPPYDKYTAMDPFGGFDLNLLFRAAATMPTG